jgi:hypothetical protein
LIANTTKIAFTFPLDFGFCPARLRSATTILSMSAQIRSAAGDGLKEAIGGIGLA